MTLKELLAKNEATRKKREAERLVAEKKEAEEKKQETPKKGKKPKKRMYLVDENLPFEEEVEEVEKEKENKEEKVDVEVSPENVDF